MTSRQGQAPSSAHGAGGRRERGKAVVLPVRPCAVAWREEEERKERAETEEEEAARVGRGRRAQEMTGRL
jgi:hypothetical protein